MSRFFIKTTETTSIITGTRMEEKGDFLYVWNGDELYGMYLSAAVVDAHRTDKPWEAVTQPFLVDAHRFMRLVGTDTCLSFDPWKTTWLAYDHPPKEATL